MAIERSSIGDARRALLDARARARWLGLRRCHIFLRKTAALRAAEAQEEAADQGLQAARDLAETERAALLNELAEADRQLDLADLLYRNAVLTLEETETREELGLAIPLETQQAALALLRAELELSQARQQQLERTLALYTFTAQPILEETPQ